MHQPSSCLYHLIPSVCDTRLVSAQNSHTIHTPYLTYQKYCSLWPPCVADADIIFLSCFFLLSLFFFFFSFLISAVGDWMSTILPTHGGAQVQIQNAGLKCAACGSLEMQDPKSCQKFTIWAPLHNFVWPYLRN